MEAQPNGSVVGPRNLKTELTEMLKDVDVPEMSGVIDQCIYRVPKKIREVNPKAYTPRVVSIGPFHHKPRGSGGDLEPMEEFKLKYLRGFLNRTPLRVGDLVLKLEELEKTIRSCYAGHVDHNRNDFLKMIIIDACFIIEFFLRYSAKVQWMENDPLLFKPWLLRDIRHDLILLENQLPFFVLENIYILANINHSPYGKNHDSPSFCDITLHYFQCSNPQNIYLERERPKHFTDLLRTLMLPSSFDQGETEQGYPIEQVYSASQLSKAGLVFKVSEQSTCLLDIEYHEGVLTMPCFNVHATTEVYMRNILAFEECHLPYSAYISQYFSILDFLINTEKDVSILVDNKIIVNWMGDANSVATMVNNLLKNVTLPDLSPKYLFLCQGLNGFYEDPHKKYKPIFIHEYFNTSPNWKLASSFAAVLLLLLTLIQTICSVISVI